MMLLFLVAQTSAVCTRRNPVDCGSSSERLPSSIEDEGDSSSDSDEGNEDETPPCRRLRCGGRRPGRPGRGGN